MTDHQELVKMLKYQEVVCGCCDNILKPTSSINYSCSKRCTQMSDYNGVVFITINIEGYVIYTDIGASTVTVVKAIIPNDIRIDLPSTTKIINVTSSKLKNTIYAATIL